MRRTTGRSWWLALAAVVLAWVAIATPANATPTARSVTSAVGVAGHGTLSGTVTTAGSGEAVAGVWVALIRTNDMVLAAQGAADEAGAFTLDAEAGQYFLYLIDPGGSHATGFWGAPEAVDVVAGEVTMAEPVMDLTTGSVTGVVTDDESGDPVAGAWAVALTAGGVPEAGAVADASGRFTFHALRAGVHRIAYLDPSAAHVSEFYADSPDAVGSTALAITAGGNATADASLARQSMAPASSAIQGTVTEAGSNAPLPDVLVIALRSTDFRLAGAAVTSASGEYQVDVALGAYRLAFLDTAGGHDMEWYADQPYNALDSASTVTVPSTIDASLTPNTGAIGGTVVDNVTGDPIGDAWVLAIDATGRLQGASTDGDGIFAITGLPVGSYRAAFVDATGGRALEYWDDSADYEGADPFLVTPSSFTQVDARLSEAAPDLVDSALGWWDASSGLLPNGDLPDLTGAGRDLALREGFEPSYPPALLVPDPARGRHLFSPGWDDMYLDTTDPAVPIAGIDVAWDGDLDRVLDVAAWKDINWVVHQGSSEDGTLAWAVGIVAATGQVEVRWSADGTTVSAATSTVAFPAGGQRGAVTVDPVTGDLRVYRQDSAAPEASFDLPYDDPAWALIDHVAGAGPVLLHDSDAPIRHSSAVPRDQIGGSTGEGWFKAMYRTRVRNVPGSANLAYFDVDLIPQEPEWFTETGLPPLFPGNVDGEARSTTFPGRSGESWTIHNYTTTSYPILVVDRPYVVFGNHSFGTIGVNDASLGIGPGEDFSVWIAYAYPRVGSGGGPFVAAKNWSPSASTPGWMLLTSPYFGGPSAVVSDGTAVAFDPAATANDGRINLSGLQLDAANRTVQSFTDGVASGAPVSLGEMGALSDPGAALTVAGYSDNGIGGASFAFASLVVFDRLLTPDEIARLPAELGLAGGPVAAFGGQ